METIMTLIYPGPGIITLAQLLIFFGSVFILLGILYVIGDYLDKLIERRGVNMNDKRTNLIWVDLETTGLDSNNDEIVEIATIVTDSQLNILAEGPSLVIYQPESVLAKMNDWVSKQHGQSGLTERIRASRISLSEAETQTLGFLQQLTGSKTSPMCGSSIGFDRKFLARYMPTLEAHFHYRNVDVSTVKELVRRWAPEIADGVKKKCAHLAMDDIRESVAELQYYKAKVFNL